MRNWLSGLVAFLVLATPVLSNPQIGGLNGPFPNTEVQTPLPANLKEKNTGGRDGAGLCVFDSITYCARYQNERLLIYLFDKMKQEPGGGWPEKVDAMLKKYAPGVQYIQDTTANYALLELAIKTGRPCGVTYDGHDPHYGANTTIAHMVQLVYCDDQYVCISDNNFTGDDQYMWMTKADFITRWKGNGGGWSVILLHTPPPPPPHN